MSPYTIVRLTPNAVKKLSISEEVKINDYNWIFPKSMIYDILCDIEKSGDPMLKEKYGKLKGQLDELEVKDLLENL